MVEIIICPKVSLSDGNEGSLCDFTQEELSQTLPGRAHCSISRGAAALGRETWSVSLGVKMRGAAGGKS